MTNKDYYQILGVSKDAESDEIKKAYRKKAMEYHPDRNNGNKEAESKFKEINEAYSILSDPMKKQQYDTFGSVGGGNPFGGGAGFNVDIDLGDIFESFFGGNFSSGGKRKRKTEQKGEDLEYRLKIDLKTSIYGGKQTIKYKKLETCKSCNGEGGSSKKSCSKCSGTGHVTRNQSTIFGVIQQTTPCNNCSGIGEEFEKICLECHSKKRVEKEVEIDVDIPAGINSGMIIKISGVGNAGIGTKAYGDLFIKFSVNLEEKGLIRKDYDLHYEVEISVIEAILGTKKEIIIPIIGKRTISINSGTQFGSTIKIHGDGVKYIESDKKGDLFIELDIKIPKKLSKNERDLYEKIAKEKNINVNTKKGLFEGLFE